MPRILNALKSIWSLRKFIFGIWAINVLVGAGFLLPYAKTFSDFFSNRQVTEILAVRNIYTYYAEFYYRMDSPVSSAVSWLQVGNVFHYFLILFLTGGIISSLFMKIRPDFKEFLKNCRYYGWRMFRVALITPLMLLFLFLVGILLSIPFTFFLPDYFVEDQYFYFLTISLILITCSILWGLLVVDIVKVKMIENNEHKVSRSIFLAIGLFIKNPLKISGFYLIMFFLWLIVIVIYWFLQQYLNDRSLGGIITELLIFQCIIFIQLWVRFARYDILCQLLKTPEN